MKNRTVWKDLNGENIQAHGGCIIEYDGKYYWYGENKGQDNCPDSCRVDVIGVSCYSSLDLLHWKYEGLVLEADKENEDSVLHKSRVLERPKVIYNEATKKFVMWMHLDNADYTYASAGVAISDSPSGPFVLLRAIQPNRQDLRDMTLFKDRDIKQGYVHNLINNCYDGCCLAFHRDLVKMILPIPRSVSMHDQWIGLVAEKAGRVFFCNEKLLQHRRHGAAPVKKYGLTMMFKTSYQVTRRLQEMNSYVRYLNGIWKGAADGTEKA